MNNIIKLIYSLALIKGKDKFCYIEYYMKYANLIDKRTLALGFDGRFVLDESGGIKYLLEYLCDKNKYQQEAKRRWEKLRDQLGTKEGWDE